MPIYQIENPNTGQILEIEGPNPPSDQELDKIFEDLKPGSTKLQKVRDNLDTGVGITAGAIGLPFGGGPLLGAAGTGAGYAIKNIMTPMKASDYTGETGILGLPKLSEQGRKAKLDSVKEMIGKSAKAGVAFDLIQGLFGTKGSVSGRVARPKQTTMEYRTSQARLNPGPGVPKSDFINQVLRKTEPLKESTGFLKPINRFQGELGAKYAQQPELLSTSDMLSMKANANAGGYKGGNLSSSAAGKFDQKTGDVLRGLVKNNSKTVAFADKVYGLLNKVPRQVNKLGRTATKVASTVGLLKLLGL